jgi:YD repeat-containing protein
MSVISGIGTSASFLSPFAAGTGGKGGANADVGSGGNAGGASASSTGGDTTTTVTNPDGSTTTTVTDSAGNIISITTTQSPQNAQHVAGNTANVLASPGSPRSLNMTV